MNPWLVFQRRHNLSEIFCTMNTLTLNPGQPAPASARQDATTIGLIGLAHGTSHFWSIAIQQQFYLFWPAVGWWLSHSKLALEAQ